MSSFVVHENHINVMVHMAVEANLLDGYATDDFGQMLWNVNAAAVNQQYGNGELVPTFEYHRPLRLPTNEEIVGIVDCYNHQIPAYKSTDAFAFVTAVLEIVADVVDPKADYAAWAWAYA